MSKVKKKDLISYLAANAGALSNNSDGTYIIIVPAGHRNIGKPDSSNKWDSHQLTRAWGDATGIPNPRW